MNKLMGFYELKDSSLPSIPWKLYDPSVHLDENILWTIRSAVNRGNDLNLPRLVGKDASDAKIFADDLYYKIGKNGIVIYYPYFKAHKSGTLNVFGDKFVIEAVSEDLWNLVTEHNLDMSVTYDFEMNTLSTYGNTNFLSSDEFNELYSNAKKIKSMYRDELLEGKSILLEWSLASACDKNYVSVGDIYLVFYEVRTI